MNMMSSANQKYVNNSLVIFRVFVQSRPLMTVSRNAVKSLGEIAFPYLKPFLVETFIGSNARGISVVLLVFVFLCSLIYYVSASCIFRYFSTELIFILSQVFSYSTKAVHRSRLFSYPGSVNCARVKN